MLLFVFLFITKQKIPFREIKKELPLLLLSGHCDVILSCFIQGNDAKKAMDLFFMSTFGILLIMGIGDLSSGRNHLLGILFGLGAACFYTAVLLLNKFIKKAEGIHRTFLQFIAAIIKKS